MADENTAKLLLRVPVGEPVYGVAVDASGSTMVAISDKGAGYYDRSGTLVWLKTLGLLQRAITISRDGSTILASGNDKVVTCIGRNGVPEWNFVAKGHVWGLATTTDGMLIFIASADGHIYCLNHSGQLIWDQNIAVPLWCAACSPDSSIISAGGTDGSLFALDRTGNVLWRQCPGGWVKATAVSEDGSLVLAGSWDDVVFCYSAQGKLLWRARVGSAVYSVAVNRATGVVAVGSDDDHVYMLDLDGNILWKQNLGNSVYSVALSGSGLELLAGTKSGQLLVFSSAEPATAAARKRIATVNTALNGYRALNLGIPVQLEKDITDIGARISAASLAEVVRSIAALQERGKRLVSAKELVMPLGEFRRAAAAARTAGVSAEAVGSIEQAVEMAVKDENFSGAKDAIRAGISQMERMKTEISPLIQISIVGASTFKIEQWGKIDLRIANVGTGAARGFLVKVNGPVEYQVPSDLPFVKQGESLAFGVGVRPMAAGKVPVEIIGEYQDPKGMALKARTSCWLDIEGKPDKIAEHITIGAIGTLIGKQVAGDNVEAGGAIIKDSVLNRSTVGGSQGGSVQVEGQPQTGAIVQDSLVSRSNITGAQGPLEDTIMTRSKTPDTPVQPATKSFKNCPYCGQEIALPKTPVFCPFCGERLIA